MHLDSRIQHEVEDGIEKMGKSLHVRWLPNFHGELGGGVHSIVKLNTMCCKKNSTFGKLHHQNGSKFYEFIFTNRYTRFLLHSKKR